MPRRPAKVKLAGSVFAARYPAADDETDETDGEQREIGRFGHCGSASSPDGLRERGTGRSKGQQQNDWQAAQHAEIPE
jgi:hypothetical protein